MYAIVSETHCSIDYQPICNGSFQRLNHDVTVARENKLGLRTYYGSDRHGTASKDVAEYFFGNFTMSPLPKNKTCEQQATTLEKLPSQVLQARGTKSECVVFKIGVGPPEENGEGENLPYFRRMFEANEVDRRRIYEKKLNPCTTNVIRVAVHIRRGDLLSYLKGNSIQTAKRLVHENAYVDLLNQLINKLEGIGRHTIIEIRLFCEDMVYPSNIPSAVDWELVDLREKLAFNDSITKDLKVFAGSNNSIEAFDEMCFSDVLITGTSGFSHMASILCKTPIVLGIPFWLSYDYVPNALVSTVTKYIIA